MNCNSDALDIPKEKFVFIQNDSIIREQPLQSKPSGYLKDALTRFVTNRGSVICFFIILILFLYAFFAPVFSPYKITDKDPYYAYATPKNAFFSSLGIWDGCKKAEVNLQTYQYLSNIPGAVKKFYGEKEHLVANRPQKWYRIKIDTYEKTGWVSMLLTPEEYAEARNYESKSGKRLFYPIIDQKLVGNATYKNDQNAWFETDAKGIAKTGKDGKVKDIFLKDKDSKDGNAYYISRMNGQQYETRILYKEWYYYKHGHYAHFLFGTDTSGYDIFTRLAHGARLSLCLSLIVSAINLFIGIIVGALEGYYGGTFDLIFERIKDIIYEVPTQITMVLFQIYLAKKLGPLAALFFAFVFYGWIGVSSTVRAQFYRFKGQDYINASRTLGAKDSRLIFRHILPNAIGFIITVSVLTIPGVIFSEASLSYLGIVDLDSDTITSVGTMLSAARDTLSTYPHALFFPAAFISILLVCFNEFGNGLRDAFNPSLRGAEK
ncbi:MAG: ABC transporter permease [Treponema sp.]|nr:ABC transporter permease [Treponema sp.]